MSPAKRTKNSATSAVPISADTTANVADDIKRIRTALWKRAPFIASLMARARILLTNLVPTAGVDMRTWVYINPDFWSKLDLLGKTYVMAHEICGHAAFSHPVREKSRVSEPNSEPGKHIIWNVAADAKTYQIISELVRDPEMEKMSVSPHTIFKLTKEEFSEEDIKKMSVEEVYDILMKNVKIIKVDVIVDIIPGNGPSDGSENGVGSENGAGDGVVQGKDKSKNGPGSKTGTGSSVTVVQGGDPVFQSGSSGQIKDEWKKFIAGAYMSQKTAGTVPSGLERAVNELIRPKINPRSIIRQAIRTGLGKLLVSDWKRKSRRYADILPGIKRLTIPTIWSLVDASGSIGEKELKIFLGTVYEFSRHAKINAISFDADAYDLVTAKRPSEVITKIAKRIKGGGGTMIKPALEKTLKQMKTKDIVLVLTDGEIFDLEDPNVRPLLAKVASKASVCAFITSDRKPDVKGWRVIELSG